MFATKIHNGTPKRLLTAVTVVDSWQGFIFYEGKGDFYQRERHALAENGITFCFEWKYEDVKHKIKIQPTRLADGAVTFPTFPYKSSPFAVHRNCE